MGDEKLPKLFGISYVSLHCSTRTTALHCKSICTTLHQKCKFYIVYIIKSMQQNELAATLPPSTAKLVSISSRVLLNYQTQPPLSLYPCMAEPILLMDALLLFHFSGS